MSKKVDLEKNNTTTNSRTKNNTTYKILILIGLLIIIGILCAILVFIKFNKDDSNDVYAKEVKFSTEYKVKDGTYIFKKDKPIDVKVDLQNDSKEDIDLSKLKFKVGDSDVCEIDENNGECTILGKKEGHTFLRIIYDNKKLKVVPISFESKKEDKTQNKSQNSNKDSSSNKSSSSNNSSSNNSNNSNNSSSNNMESNSDVDLTVKGYLQNYPNAVAYGDVSYVSDYLTGYGDFYKELETTLPDRYDKGVTVEVLSYEKDSMTKEGNTYRTGYTIHYYVHRPIDGDVYQTEYMEFILVPSDSGWIIDRYENWQLLDQSKS